MIDRAERIGSLGHAISRGYCAGTPPLTNLAEWIVDHPQAHIDALVEAGVLAKRWCNPKDPTAQFQDNHYAVVKPHVHEWYVAGIAHVHGTERSASLRCECGVTRSATNRLPIEVPDA